VDFLFKDEAFKFETLRAAGFASDAGADIGEVIVTTAQIPEGDEDAWTAAWSATAERIAQRGAASLEVGDRVSAREAFLRASSYYRSAEFYRRKDPLNDPQVLELSRLSKHYLVKAGGLMDGPFAEVTIPYADGEIPGYLFLVDASGQPRPTVIYTNGFDSTREESYFVIGAAALRRGYNFLAYDGPGQGWMIREKKVPYRPDWENVLGPVVDYALTVPEIDNDKIVHFGYSLGGYLPRDHRATCRCWCHGGLPRQEGSAHANHHNQRLPQRPVARRRRRGLRVGEPRHDTRVPMLPRPRTHDPGRRHREPSVERGHHGVHPG
jgi:hypothetical protein